MIKYLLVRQIQRRTISMNTESRQDHYYLNVSSVSVRIFLKCGHGVPEIALI